MKLHWGNALVLFFAIFLSLAGIFIVFAMRQNNDLVTTDYYEKGAAYSTQIAINERSAPLAESFIFTTTPSQIEISVDDTISQNTKNINIHFYRPSGQHDDFKTVFTVTDSVFSVDKANLIKGRYIVKISWEMNALEYYLEKTYFIE